MGLADVNSAEVPALKKKKKRKTTKKKQDPKDTAAMEAIVKSVYGITASRFGPVWNISDDEAKSIAVPLASILARYEKLIMVSQYSDVAMLVLAIGSVTIPRFMVTMQERKEAKKAERPATERIGQAPGEGSGFVSGSIKERIPALDPGTY